MKAVGNYKAMIEEVGKTISFFANFRESPFKDGAKEQGWTLEYINKIDRKVLLSSCMPGQIKQELIGDGDEAKFVGRLKTAFFELNSRPTFAPSFFPEFDEACFAQPSKDNPDRNRGLFDALTAVYGDGAAKMMAGLENICQVANMIVQDLCNTLDDVCKFVGYTPEPQQGEQETQQEQPEPQQIPTIFNFDREKKVFGRALDKEYMELKSGGCYEWKKTKSLLAYMCGKLYCGDFVKEDASDYSVKLIKSKSRLPKQELQKLFNVDVGNNRDQLKAPPRQYYLIDELFAR